LEPKVNLFGHQNYAEIATIDDIQSAECEIFIGENNNDWQNEDHQRVATSDGYEQT
jgi:hypothetical protein